MDKWWTCWFMFSVLIWNLVFGNGLQDDVPIIGGICDPNSKEIEIGGKKTQLYLTCVPKTGLAKSIGTWVVRSRTLENFKEYQVKKKKLHVCAQNYTIRETHHCDITSRCLQPTAELNAYLQCDLLHSVWIKRYCKPGQIFSFEFQTCYGKKRHVARQSLSSGIVCTYTGCLNSRQCTAGSSCNSGYCCSKASRKTSITICPNGGTSSGVCNNGYCSTGYSCTTDNICCPSTSGYGYACPSGYYASGTCNAGCGRGCSCNTNTNTCCCVQGMICADGTQAVGACVQGQCGTGFTCTNGLCCSSSSLTYRCLDGSDAVGFCINCQCGGNYYCTTGNLCCPIFTSVCPTGTTSIGPCVNGICPDGYTCYGTGTNQQCCGTVSTVTCLAQDAAGPCINGGCGAGFTCDTTNDQCCPNLGDLLGPCLTGEAQECPTGAYCLQSDEQCYTLLT